VNFLGDILATLGNTKICVTRHTQGRIVGGKRKVSKKRPFHIEAGVQQINGRERELLPEGWRQSYIVKVYTDKRLYASDDAKNQQADLLEIDGERFEVVMQAPFKGLDLDHFRYFAARANA